MSIYSMVGGLGLLVGPYVGGIIVTHLGWKWIFFINVPVIIVGFIICGPFVGALNAHATRVKIDWLGCALLLISLSSLIYGLIRQQQFGVDAVTLIDCLVFIVAVVFLLYVEKRQAYPIISFAFFKKADFIVPILLNIQSGALISCGMFFSPLFLQKTLHYSPMAAGTILLGFAVGVIMFSPIVGQITKKLHENQTICLGLLCGFTASIF